MLGALSPNAQACGYIPDRLCVGMQPRMCHTTLNRYVDLNRDYYKTLDRLLTHSPGGVLTMAAQGLGSFADQVTGGAQLLTVRQRLAREHRTIRRIQNQVNAFGSHAAWNSESYAALLQVRRELGQSCRALEATRSLMIGSGEVYAERSRNVALGAGVVATGGGVFAGSMAVAGAGGMIIMGAGPMDEALYPRQRPRPTGTPTSEPTYFELESPEPQPPATTTATTSVSSTPRYQRPRQLPNEGSEPPPGYREVHALGRAQLRSRSQIAQELTQMSQTGETNRSLIEIAADLEQHRIPRNRRITEGEYTYVLSHLHQAFDRLPHAASQDSPQTSWAQTIDQGINQILESIASQQNSEQHSVLQSLLSTGQNGAVADDEIRSMVLASALTEMRDVLPAHIQVAVEVYQNRIQTVLHDTQNHVVYNPITWESHDENVAQLHSPSVIAQSLLARMQGRRASNATNQIAQREDTQTQRARSRSAQSQYNPLFSWPQSRALLPEQEAAQELQNIAQIAHVAGPPQSLVSAPSPVTTATPSDDYSDVDVSNITIPTPLSRAQALERFQNQLLRDPEHAPRGLAHALLSLQRAQFGGESRTLYDQAMRRHLETVEIIRNRTRGVTDLAQRERIAARIAVQRHFSGYTLVSTRIVNAMLGNGVNCQGGPQELLSLLVDAGIEVPAGQVRGVQVFGDHVQVVRIDPATSTVYDVLTQNIDGTRGQIRSTVYFEGKTAFAALTGQGFSEAQIGVTNQNLVAYPSNQPADSAASPLSVRALLGWQSNSMEWGDESHNFLPAGSDGPPDFATISAPSLDGVPQETGTSDNARPEGLATSVSSFFSNLWSGSSSRGGGSTTGSAPEQTRTREQRTQEYAEHLANINPELDSQLKARLQAQFSEIMRASPVDFSDGFSHIPQAQRADFISRVAQMTELLVHATVYEDTTERERANLLSSTGTASLSAEDQAQRNLQMGAIRNIVSNFQNPLNRIGIEGRESAQLLMQNSPTLAQLSNIELERAHMIRRNPQPVLARILDQTMHTEALTSRLTDHHFPKPLNPSPVQSTDWLQAQFDASHTAIIREFANNVRIVRDTSARTPRVATPLRPQFRIFVPEVLEQRRNQRSALDPQVQATDSNQRRAGQSTLDPNLQEGPNRSSHQNDVDPQAAILIEPSQETPVQFEVDADTYRNFLLDAIDHLDLSSSAPSIARILEALHQASSLDEGHSYLFHRLINKVSPGSLAGILLNLQGNAGTVTIGDHTLSLNQVGMALFHSLVDGNPFWTEHDNLPHYIYTGRFLRTLGFNGDPCHLAASGHRISLQHNTSQIHYSTGVVTRSGTLDCNNDPAARFQEEQRRLHPSPLDGILLP